jgi:hypothetical protein
MPCADHALGHKPAHEEGTFAAGEIKMNTQNKAPRGGRWERCHALCDAHYYDSLPGADRANEYWCIVKSFVQSFKADRAHEQCHSAQQGVRCFIQPGLCQCSSAFAMLAG